MVQRYNLIFPENGDDGVVGVTDSEFGRFVRHADYTALERERDELQEELHQKLMYSGGEISRLEADNGLLMKRLEVACHVKADDKVGFDFAVLDKIDSLERERDKVRNIVKFLEERLRHYYKVMEKRYNRIEDLESENAMLKKQLDALKTMLKVEWNLLN